MDIHSHNLLETYYDDGSNQFHYNSLRSGENLFRVDFTRTVSSSGIAININSITGDPAPTSEDVAFLTSEINSLQGLPLNGNECVTLGWTYLGHYKTNQQNIDAAIADCQSKGSSFRSIYYITGYTVYGCPDMKLFYDVG